MTLLKHDGTTLINWVDPINRLHPLVRSMNNWWMPVSGAVGGGALFDLCRFNSALFANPPQPDGPPRPGGNVALTYNGSDQYAVADNEAPLRFGTDDFTLSAWFRNTNGAGGTQCICSKDDFTSGGRWAFYVHTDQGLTFSSNGDFTGLRGSNGLKGGGLLHKSVIIRRGDLRELWGNGILEVSNATYFSGDDLNIGGRFLIGANDNAGAGAEWFWGGQIDAIQIWKGRAFTADQIRWLRYEAMQGFPDMLNWVDRRVFLPVAAVGGVNTGRRLLYGQKLDRLSLVG